jgi:hypothetical protein
MLRLFTASVLVLKRFDLFPFSLCCRPPIKSYLVFTGTSLLFGQLLFPDLLSTHGCRCPVFQGCTTTLPKLLQGSVYRKKSQLKPASVRHNTLNTLPHCTRPTGLERGHVKCGAFQIAVIGSLGRDLKLNGITPFLLTTDQNGN